MKKILFVCIENSNRSQMAEAFARIHCPSPSLPQGKGENEIQVFSAGSKPSGKINPKAIDAMKEVGYDLTTHQSKSIDEVMNSLSLGEGRGEALDYIVTMGCGDACPFIPAKHRLDWQIPQPKDMNKEEFRKVRDMIEEKVKKLMEDV
ncbi:MAG: arsenate reductase ArsC [Bacteroidetes bacterium]|nr:arsenate reductase ArsC [Bacteroidota bacterium]